MWKRLMVFATFALGVLVLGCAPPKVVSPQANELPLLDQDPRENGENLGRWPCFRGPQCQGIAPAGNPPVRFGPEQNLRWKTPLPGRGNSSPVVWDDYVVLTSALEQFDPPQLVVLCLDRWSGRQLWQAPAGEARGQTHPKNGYASASVATDGERIFAFFGATGLFCFDFNGQLQWRTELGDLHHQWGLAASPVLFDNLVIQLCDSQGESYLAAFDKATGRPVWRTQRPSTGCWSTPVVVRPTTEAGGDDSADQPPAASHADRLSAAAGPARPELIVNGAQSRDGQGRLVIAYDPRTGNELWRAGSTTELVTPVPLLGAGMVFSLSGRNGPIMALRTGGSGDVSQTHLVWKLSRGGPYIPSGLVYRNRLYVIDDAGRLTCYNAGNGRQLWSRRLSGPVTASLVAAAGRIYVTNEHGTVYVVGAGDEFELLAENKLHSRCLATPAIVHDDLLIRTEDTLYCFAGGSPPAGSKSQPTERPVRRTRRESVHTDSGGADSAGAESGGSDSSTITPAGSQPGAAEPHGVQFAGTPFEASPSGGGQAQVAQTESAEPQRVPGAQSGPAQHGPAEPKPAEDAEPQATAESWPLFRADRQATGVARSSLPLRLEVLWTFENEHDAFEATAAIAQGKVFIGSLGGSFYAFDLQSGKKLWEFPTPLGFTASAAVRGDRVYVGDADGMFYCLEADTGRKLWDFQTEAEINSSANFHAGRVLFGSQDTHLYCLAADTGRLVWKHESADQIRCFPTVAGEFTFVAGCDGRLHIIRLSDGTEAGQVDLQAPTGSAPACLGDMIFVGTEGNTFFGIDWRRRRKVWSYENVERPWPFRSSAAVTEQLVVVGSQDKRVHAFEPRTGREVWSFATKGRVDGSPVVVDKRVFVGSLDGRLYALDLASGRELWHFEAGGGIIASPAVAAGRLVIGTETGRLYCFGANAARNR